MLNFEQLNGFVIDLSTNQSCDEILEDILCGDGNEFDRVIAQPLQCKQEYILEYFTDTYSYVFCKRPYVYQIVEEDLEVYS